ncbi:MAG: bacteriohopanetetrol glucosamine biosynthesis glycosyltransferase HpnI [Gammaproteobacteria bacterium]|nr:bacteriohopanetetrol glucosamine biosynthesis glycosyltransferase HpnI [Gammaproteobacteria bacterium]
MDSSEIVFYLLVLVSLCAITYLLFANFCIIELRKNIKRPHIPSGFTPAVTIFKPICGIEQDMDENLRSFCEQDYPEYQVIFGLHGNDDDAIPVIQKIIEDYPQLDLEMVIDARLHGSNHKVSNLINMFPSAKHEILIVSDSDMRVRKNYLHDVVAPFANTANGAVTCLYSGRTDDGVASKLNAMFINEWFLPSVLISDALKDISYCLGATMAVRREILTDFGGFEALANYLADDYMLGQMVSERGYKVYLSYTIVENLSYEPNYKSLFLHELRWARTLRAAEPLGYMGTFLTDTLMISSLTAFFALLFTQHTFLPASILGITITARILLHLQVKSALELDVRGSLVLIPVRDMMSFVIRVVSYMGNSIEWRNHTFSIDDDGLMHEDAKTDAELIVKEDS